MIIAVTIRFMSDWHVGQGAGRPKDLDAMVRPDVEGYPYVPAKTLGQMWRDACERVAAGLDEETDTGWSDLVVHLFGSQPRDSKPGDSPIPARLHPSPCRYPMAVRSKLHPDWLTFPKIEVAIDPSTGAARHDHLRTVEMARVGSKLYGDVRLDVDDWDEATKTAALALLRAGLVELTRLGGKRRRGAGRVEVTAEDLPDLKGALRILERDAPTIQARSVNTVTAPLADHDAHTWFAAELTIELHQPVVVADRTAGNVVSTRDYIPGTFLLGPVVGALDGGWQNLLPKVQAGAVRVLNAYRDVAGNRGLPVPFSLFHEKGEGGLADGTKVWNLLHAQVPTGTQPVQHRRGYVAGDRAQTRLETVEIGTHTHSTIDDEVQRPTERVGGVYTYQTIQPGTIFRSKVLVSADEEPAGDFEVEVNLGTSKKDDYGQATLRCSKFRKTETPSAGAKTKSVILWLLSDLLVRSPANQPAVSPVDLEPLLSAELGVAVKAGQSFVRPRRSEGWVGRWGLPRPSLIGLGAGSAIRLSFSEDVKVSTLAALEQRGLGERTAEGFGEVRFSAPLLAAKPPTYIDAPDSRDGEAPTEEEDPGVATFASGVLAEHTRNTLARAAALAAANSKHRQDSLGWSESRPTNSQLGALRAALRSDEALRAWWSGVKAVPNRANKWPKAAKRALDQLIKHPEGIYNELGVVTDWPPGYAVRLYLDSAVRHELRDRQRPGGAKGRHTDG